MIKEKQIKIYSILVFSENTYTFCKGVNNFFGYKPIKNQEGEHYLLHSSCSTDLFSESLGKKIKILSMSFVISNNNIWKSEGAANSVLYKKKKKDKNA